MLVWMWLEILGLKTVQTDRNIQNFIEFFNRGNNMGCDANKKNMGSKKILKN